jgi:polyisoprenoid-binding protein YceI
LSRGRLLVAFATARAARLRLLGYGAAAIALRWQEKLARLPLTGFEWGLPSPRMKLWFAATFAALLCPLALSAASQTLVVDKAASSVAVDVKATIDSFVARFTDFDAQIQVQGSIVPMVSGTIHFLFTDLKTGDDDRDQEMYKWQDNEKYPDGQFTLDSVTPDDVGNFIANGRLRFHGTEREGSFPVKINIQKKILTIEGEADLDTRDYGLPVYRKFIVFSVSPKVHVRFKIIGKLVTQ